MTPPRIAGFDPISYRVRVTTAEPVYYKFSRSNLKVKVRGWNVKVTAQRKVKHLQWKRCNTATDRLSDFNIGMGVVKLKFHWDQFPRNFPVANVTGKSPTSYEEVGRVWRLASLLRVSWRRRQQVREEVTEKLVPVEFELKTAWRQATASGCNTSQLRKCHVF